jgi:hypothetical protein
MMKGDYGNFLKSNGNLPFLRSGWWLFLLFLWFNEIFKFIHGFLRGLVRGPLIAALATRLDTLAASAGRALDIERRLNSSRQFILIYHILI